MNERLKSTFDKIHAEDALLDKTAGFLQSEISKRSSVYRSPRVKLAAVCAAFVLLLVGGFFSHNLYYEASAYVDLDVNPSIEITVNRFGRVLETLPHNSDGEKILQELDVRHRTYEQAVRALLDEMFLQGYLAEDGLVSVTVQTGRSGAEEKMLEEIKAAISALLSTRSFSVSSDVFAVSQEVRDRAHEYDISPAKYLAITQLQEVDPTATFENCAGHSISEIHKLTEEHSGRHHGSAQADNSELTTSATDEDYYESHGGSHSEGEEKDHSYQVYTPSHNSDHYEDENHNTVATPSPDVYNPPTPSPGKHGEHKNHSSGNGEH